MVSERYAHRTPLLVPSVQLAKLTSKLKLSPVRPLAELNTEAPPKGRRLGNNRGRHLLGKRSRFGIIVT